MTRLLPWTLAMCVGLAAQLSLAQEQKGEQPDPVVERMRQAYRDLDHYAATTKFSVVLTHGRKTRREWKTYDVAYTKAGPQLKLDRPEMLLVVDGGQLRFRLAQLPNRFVETSVPSPLTFASVSEYLGAFQPAPIDAAMLLSDDPLDTIEGGPTGAVESTPAEASEDGKPRVRFPTRSGAMTLTLDPASYLITRAELELDAAAGGMLPGSSITKVSEIGVQPGAAAPAGAFAFDPAGGQSVDSLEALIGQGGAEPPSPLIGQAAAPLRFKTPDGKSQSLEDIKTDVVVLDFWATWCGPCHRWMPDLVKIHEWAQANGHPVTIVGVTVDDPSDVDRAKELWREKNYPMILAIPEDRAAIDLGYAPEERDAMGNVQRSMSLPYTVIIHKGKIATTHVGVGPNTRDEVQQEIEDLLRKADAAP